MTATNIQLDGMTNNAVSVTLSAVAEALEWTHTLEEGLPKRPTQRVVFYTASLYHLEAVPRSGDPCLDTEDGHDLAYEKILDACSKFASPPVFYRSDQLDSLEPETAAKVPGWMHSAEQISIGGRRQVLEDGSDVFNSESDPDTDDDHGSEIKDAYQGIHTDSHGDSLGTIHKVPTEQANAMRASAKQASSWVSRMDPPPVQERKAAPMNSDKDDPQTMSYDQERAVKHARKMAGAPLEKSSQVNESTHVMVTRSQEKKTNRAGGLPPAVGSGQKDTRVTKGHPSKT
jgi:hypothetical protein